LAGRIISHYLAYSEDAELIRAGDHICKSHPRLWELGIAATDAKTKLRQQWESEARAKAVAADELS
jgi:hypothetical protein